MTVVFTAQIGDQTDQVRAPLVIDPQAHYVCFADRPVCVPPYEWVAVPTARDPRLSSRSYKILANHPALTGATRTLWHDASYRLTRDVGWVRTELQKTADLVAFRHAREWRNLKFESRRLVKYGYLTRQEASAHLRRYRAEGFPLHGPLTCGGLLARRQSPHMAAFNRLWWTEVQRWGGRDQTSLHYVAWVSGVVVGHLEGQIKANAYAQWRETGVEVAA